MLPPEVALTYVPNPTATQTATLVVVTPSPTIESTSTPTSESPTVAPIVTATPTPLGGGRGQLAFASDRNGGIPQVWLMDATGTVIRQITNEPEGACQPDWSPDGLRLVYVSPCRKKQDNYDGSSLYIINVDGSGKKELAQIAGLSQLLHWQDANHFYVISNTVDLWEIDLIGTDGDQPEKIASYTDSGIVTWFGSKNSLTYVTNHFESWTWNRIDGKNTTFLATWPNYAAQCKKSTGNMILGEASNNSSPDGLHGLVGVWCDDGSTSFYFVNNDGSKIIQLFGANIPSQFIDANWSPDGQNIVITLGNNQTGNSDFYLINVNKILQDPSIQPIQLTNDKAWKYDASWQPQP